MALRKTSPVARFHVAKYTPRSRGTAAISTTLPYFVQEGDNWCWAACGQMLTRYVHQQCAVADLGQGRADCCQSSPPTPACDNTLTDSDITKLAIALGFSHCSITTPLTFTLLERQVQKHGAIQAGLTWTKDGTGHVVLVVETDDSGGKETVRVHDPDRRRLSVNILFTELQHAYALGIWDATWEDLY